MSEQSQQSQPLTVNGKTLTISADELVRHTAREAERATAWVPHSKALIRVARIVELRGDPYNMSFEEIAKDPKVKMSVNGVIAAYYRTVNRFIPPEDIHAHVERQMQRLDAASDMAVALYDKKKGLQSLGAIREVVRIEDRRSKLLGLDAPQRTGTKGDASSIFGMLANVPPLSQDQLRDIQNLDPIVKPNGSIETIERDGVFEESEQPEPTAAEIQQAEQMIEDNAKKLAELERDKRQPHTSAFKAL